MEYSVFCKEIKTEVEKMMGPDYSVRLESVLKNNRVRYDALIIMKKGENIAPTACLHDYYDEYNRGRNIADIALSLIVWYEQHKAEIKVDIEGFSNYDSMKTKIYVRVINAKMNSELLKSLPHICYFDLAMIAYWAVEEEGIRKGTANVTNGLLKLWNIDKETLFFDAIANTKEINPPRLMHISDMMREILASSIKSSYYHIGEDLFPLYWL